MGSGSSRNLTPFAPVCRLGGVTTTVSHPASSSHAPLTADQRAKLGISDGHLRFSVGIEGPEDLWADLDRGLTAAAALGDTDKVS